MQPFSTLAMDSPFCSPSPRRAQRRPGPVAPRALPLRAARSCGLATRFQAWTGRSGQRYVVSVHSRRELPDFSEAVLLAVRVDDSGGLTLLGTRTSDDGLADWDALARADEVHVHLLARTGAQRRQVAADLRRDGEPDSDESP